MKLILPHDIVTNLRRNLEKAKQREIGGQLFGEQLGPSEFRVMHASVQTTGGTLSTFRLTALHSWFSTSQFFRRTRNSFERFNYIGEWHSHPSFELYPSSTDDRTMTDLAVDSEFKGNFAVLAIVKLQSTSLAAQAWVYLRDGNRALIELLIEESNVGERSNAP